VLPVAISLHPTDDGQIDRIIPYDKENFSQVAVYLQSAALLIDMLQHLSN